MPPLDPYKPVGALDSVALRTLDPVLGISIDGIARDIRIYGFPNMEIQRIEYAPHSLTAHNLNELNICKN